MKNHLRWSSRWLRPPMPQFPVGYTHMLVSKSAKICITPNAIPKICVTLNANPQHEQVEYRLRWALWPWGLRWANKFYVFCVDFIRVG